MYKLALGSKEHMQFANEHEYYTFLGYLAKSDNYDTISNIS